MGQRIVYLPKKLRISAVNSPDKEATRVFGKIVDKLAVLSNEPFDEEIYLEEIKGRWLKISPANIYECSVCCQNVMTEDIEEYHFCHHCGADMRKEIEDK